jgi:hypothetical protein
MNRYWIGIATDLTETQVVGAPYRAPAAAGAAPGAAPGAGYPQAPTRSYRKEIAFIAVMFALAGGLKLANLYRDAGQTAAPASQAAPIVARPLPQSVAGAVEPATAPAPRRQHATGKPASAPPSTPPSTPQADTQIDLDQYRSLTKGL